MFPGDEGDEMASEKAPDGKARPEDVDPMEDATQPLARRAAPKVEVPPADLDHGDTTTWGASAPPPLIVDDAEPEDVDEAETVVTRVERVPTVPLAPSSSLRPLLLERIEPSLGRGERIRLDASQWQLTLGRGEDSTVRLYTASASRVHASIAGNEAGEWVLVPADGTSVLIDGAPTNESVVLEVGMNIILGQDHLRCSEEGLARRETSAESPRALEEAIEESRPGLRALAQNRWLIGAVLAVGVGLLLLYGSDWRW